MKEFNDQILDSLKNHIVPWQNLNAPIDVLNKNTFTGVSRFLLNISAKQKNLKSNLLTRGLMFAGTMRPAAKWPISIRRLLTT